MRNKTRKRIFTILLSAMLVTTSVVPCVLASAEEVELDESEVTLTETAPETTDNDVEVVEEEEPVTEAESEAPEKQEEPVTEQAQEAPEEKAPEAKEEPKSAEKEQPSKKEDAQEITVPIAPAEDAEYKDTGKDPLSDAKVERKPNTGKTGAVENGTDLATKFSFKAAETIDYLEIVIRNENTELTEIEMDEVGGARYGVYKDYKVIAVDPENTEELEFITYDCKRMPVIEDADGGKSQKVKGLDKDYFEFADTDPNDDATFLKEYRIVFPNGIKKGTTVKGTIKGYMDSYNNEKAKVSLKAIYSNGNNEGSFDIGSASYAYAAPDSEADAGNEDNKPDENAEEETAESIIQPVIKLRARGASDNEVASSDWTVVSRKAEPENVKNGDTVEIEYVIKTLKELSDFRFTLTGDVNYFSSIGVQASSETEVPEDSGYKMESNDETGEIYFPNGICEDYELKLVITAVVGYPHAFTGKTFELGTSVVSKPAGEGTSSRGTIIDELNIVDKEIKLKVTSTDSEETIPGALYNVYVNQDGKEAYYAQLTTDANGEAVIYAPNGEYTFEMISLPSAYDSKTGDKTKTVDIGDNSIDLTTVTFAYDKVSEDTTPDEDETEQDLTKPYIDVAAQAVPAVDDGIANGDEIVITYVIKTLKNIDTLTFNATRQTDAYFESTTIETGSVVVPSGSNMSDIEVNNGVFTVRNVPKGIEIPVIINAKARIPESGPTPEKIGITLNTSAIISGETDENKTAVQYAVVEEPDDGGEEPVTPDGEGKITITAKSTDGAPVVKAVFDVINEDKTIATVETGNDGVVVISGLANGTYSTMFITVTCK